MDNKEDEVNLFIHADKKIEKVTAEVSEVIRSILNHGQKLDNLAERINEGVSKTAYKTWEKVSEISVAMTELKHDNEKRDLKITELTDDVKIQRTNWNTFVRVVIFGVAVSLLFILVNRYAV